MTSRSLLGINRWIRIKPDGLFPFGARSGTSATGEISVKLPSPTCNTSGPTNGRPRASRCTPDASIPPRTAVVTAGAASRHFTGVLARATWTQANERPGR